MDLESIVDTVSNTHPLMLVGGSFMAYCCSLVAVDFTCNLLEDKKDKIHSQEELDLVIAQESTRLGIEFPVSGTYHGNKNARTFCAKNHETGEYRIETGGPLVGRNLVRHELYHIYRGDIEKPRSFLKYILIQEPRAVLYSITGIKI